MRIPLIYELDKDVLKITNTSTGQVSTVNPANDRSITPVNHFGVFCFSSVDTGSYTSLGRMYYIKMETNGTVRHEYIPCVRDIDGKPGLYDIVGNQFYTTDLYQLVAGQTVNA